jgi:hypothetical protein
MGWMFVAGRCAACQTFITFNPDLVPSIRVNGVKEPLCPECVAKWEQIHGQKVNIHPEAYEPQEVL